MVPTSTFRPSAADGCSCSSGAAYDGSAAYSFYKDPEKNVKKGTDDIVGSTVYRLASTIFSYSLDLVHLIPP